MKVKIFVFSFNNHFFLADFTLNFTTINMLFSSLNTSECAKIQFILVVYLGSTFLSMRKISKLYLIYNLSTHT